MVRQQRFFVALILCIVLMLGVSCVKQDEPERIVEAVSGATDYTQMVTSAVPIEIAPLRPTVVASGVVQGKYEVMVKSRTAGIIKEIPFELGDAIEKGQVLISLDAASAEFSYQQIEQQVENSQNEVRASEQLYNRGALSLNQLTQAKAALNGLQSQLARAKDSLSDTRITSPISGSVAEKATGLVIGDTLQSGQTLARIIDLQTLRVTLALGQSQIFLVHEGAPADIQIMTPGENIVATGVVSAISAGSDAKTGSWTIVVDFENPRPDIIRAGISADITILNDKGPEYHLVPNAAMVNRDEKTYIYLLNDTTAQLTEVIVLDHYGDRTAVKSKNDSIELTDRQVLTSGLSRIVDGSSVVTQY